MRERLEELYLDYVNNWLTLDALSEHHDVPVDTLSILLELGKEFYSEGCNN